MASTALPCLGLRDHQRRLRAGHSALVDVKPTDWFYEAVAYVYEHGLMDGVGSNRFAPNASTTRAMIVTILWRLEVSRRWTTPCPLRTWRRHLVHRGRPLGRRRGHCRGLQRDRLWPRRSHHPGAAGRHPLALCQVSGAGRLHRENTNILSYTDAAEISEYAIPALQWACGAGILEGSNGSLSPAPMPPAPRSPPC